MSDNNEQELLKELEGIVNNANEQLEQEWSSHIKSLIVSMSDYADKSKALSSRSHGAVICVVSKRDNSEYDPSRIVGPVGSHLPGASVGEVSHLITLDEPSHVLDFFQDQTCMVLTQKSYEHDGYFVRIKYKSGKTKSFFVTSAFIAVAIDDKVNCWQYTEKDYHYCQNVLSPKNFDLVGAMVLGLGAPIEMRKQMPQVFDSLCEHLLSRIQEQEDSDE